MPGTCTEFSSVLFWVGVFRLVSLFLLLHFPPLCTGFILPYHLPPCCFSILPPLSFLLYHFTLSFLPSLCFPHFISVLSLTCLSSCVSRMNSVDSHIDVPLSYCNSDCSCDKNQWEPICGKNGVTYISPCLAGCKSSSVNKNSNSTVSISFHFVPFFTHKCTTDFTVT